MSERWGRCLKSSGGRCWILSQSREREQRWVSLERPGGRASKELQSRSKAVSKVSSWKKLSGRMESWLEWRVRKRRSGRAVGRMEEMEKRVSHLTMRVFVVREVRGRLIRALEERVREWRVVREMMGVGKKSSLSE